VNKIRFVAVTLLDPIDGQVNVTAMDSIAAAKNQEALMSFLGILSNIEQVGDESRDLESALTIRLWLMTTASHPRIVFRYTA
jgi:hypothetical protein